MSLKSLDNFRDVAWCTTKMKPGLMYRSARPDFLNDDDAETLTDKLDIRTIVDLRSPRDYHGPFPAATDASKSLRELFEPHTASEWARYDEYGDALVHANAQREPKRRVVFATVLDSSFVAQFVLKRLSLCEKLSIVPLYFLDKVCNTQFAQCFAVERVINQQGIEAQYEGFLEHCGRGIVRALRALNGPAALPALVHCAHGKDRTGVVCALVLKLCGASDEEVVADYVATQTNLAGDARARMRQELASVRLDPSFEGARAATMQRFLHALHAKHGGVAVYLARNGFLLDEQISLRRKLVA